MAVRVLALASVVAEVVAGGETGFYSHFKHGSGVPSISLDGRVGDRFLGLDGCGGGAASAFPSFDCTVLRWKRLCG
jgi:hypothetical protein